MPRGAKPDRELTVWVQRAFGLFEDPRSFAAVDGRIFLYGVDMTSQRGVVLAKDELCCRRCGKKVGTDVAEVDHIKARSKGGDDSLSNLRTLCAGCHRGPRGRHA